MKRQLTTHVAQVAAVGLLVTLVASVLVQMGVLDDADRKTIDLRYQYARWRPVPMSDRIKHVDIDPGALDTVGRWPWPRTRLALALDELRMAGASVVALDLLLDDAQEPDFERKEEGVWDFREVDHDLAMAESLAKFRAVLALDVGSEDARGIDWQSDRGQREYANLMEMLRGDVQWTEDEVVERASLSGSRQVRYRERSRLFSALAASQVAAEMLSRPGETPTFEDFRRRMAPRVDVNTGVFSELAMLERVWDQQRAWSELKPKLRGRTSDEPWRGVDDSAPILRFSRAAKAVGVVNAEPERESDGAIRDVQVVRPTPGGEGLQFGLAAAAEFLGIDTRDVVVAKDHVQIGDRRLPVRDGRLLLDWPRTDAEYFGAMRRTEEDPMGYGHISIGVLVSIGEQRRVLARLETEHREVTFEIATNNLGMDLEDELTPAIEREAQDYAAEVFQDVERKRLERPLTKEEEDMVGPFRQHVLLTKEIEAGRRKINDAAAQLRREVEGRLVFVGWTSTGALADFFTTPLGAKTPGVVVHAVAADMALTGRSKALAHPWAPLVFSLLLGGAATLIAAAFPPVISSIAGILLAFGYVGGAGWLLFNWSPGGQGVLLPIVGPLATGVAAWVSATALEAALFKRDKDQIRKQFRARVSPQLVEKLVENPGSVSMTGEQREMTTMFIDLAGFTSLSERLDGPATVATLNRAMRENTRVLTAENAYVNKFLGDGLMAFWSAFDIEPEQAARACRAALECQRAIGALNFDPSMKGLPPLSARVGIATGTVVVGDCGAPPELNDYTVIGNAVNLASRLESANKQFGTSIMIDGRTRDLAGDRPDEYALRRLGRIVVVGQTTPVDVYEVMPKDADQDRIATTHDAVAKFQKGDFVGALTLFHQLDERWGDKLLASVYRDGVADAADMGDAFDGAVRLRAK